MQSKVYVLIKCSYSLKLNLLEKFIFLLKVKLLVLVYSNFKEQLNSNIPKCKLIPVLKDLLIKIKLSIWKNLIIHMS